MDFEAIWQSIKDYFSNNYMSVIRFFATLIIGMIVIKIILLIFSGIFTRAKTEKIAQKFLLAIIKFVLWLVLILVLLSLVGVEITGMLTAVSAIVLAIGMALQSNIANLANGIVIISMKMFKKGDYITVGDAEGSITEINFLFTTLTTLDNKRITIPNSTIVNSAVVNFGANPVRRVNFTFSVAYDSDVEKVKSAVIDVMKSDGRVYLDPAPFCRLKTLNNSSLDFFANCWCDSDDYWDVYYYVTETVYNEFKKNGICIPFTQLEVRSRTDDVVLPFNPDPLKKRVEKSRKTEKSPLREMIDDINKKIDDNKSKRRALKEKKRAVKNKENQK
ncbi:MAG: mechanosensitive ion channel family protein [Clostridia bacterium]|nr:mechanosensitive ion channel family protein [Clostridia bacterium]